MTPIGLDHIDDNFPGKHQINRREVDDTATEAEDVQVVVNNVNEWLSICLEGRRVWFFLLLPKSKKVLSILQCSGKNF